MRQLYLLLILLGLGWLGLQAQAPGSVYLRTGEQRFPANLSAFMAQEPSPSEWVEGRYYRFIQFQNTPTEEVHQRLAQLDVKLLEYIPKATYLASMPVGLDRQAFADLPIHSVQKLLGVQKIAPLLTEGALPDWALERQDIHLVVMFPQDLVPEVGAKLLAEWGASMDKAPTYDGTVEVMINVNQIFALADLPFVTWVEAISPPAEPEDRGGRALSRANVISSNSGSGVPYDGTGIRVMVRDDGSVGPHIDFEGRIKLNVAGGGAGTHGDGVASMMAATGNLDPKASGTAPGAEIYVLNYLSTFTDNTVALHQTDSVMITNSSYSDGCNQGYTATTRRVDLQMIQNPSLLHVFSAGNSNNNNCGYGAGNQWGNITGGHKQGKNVVAVANLFPDGSLVASSSRGPAHDGRIKPDLAANGNGQIFSAPNQTYGNFSGTSAAAPTAAGSFAQLYQAYRDLNNGEYPESALIKAMMMNSAEDYGVPGPDFQFGWGRVNAFRALGILESNQYLKDTVSLGNTNVHNLTIPAGVTEVRVMVYWDDSPAFAGAARALVNDLDLTVAEPGGSTFLPLVLNHLPNAQTLDDPAVPGVDSLNNVEQVRIQNPTAGIYQIGVTGNDLPFGDHPYFIVYEFYRDDITVTYPYGGEGLVPGDEEIIHWDAYGISAPFTLEYTTNDGQSWNPIITMPGDSRLYTWTVPDSITGEARVRVSRGAVSGQSPSTFSIIGTPSNVQVISFCTQQAQLSWSAVPGAVAYEVYYLGERYMDSVTTVSQPFACVPIDANRTDHWFAVSAIPAQGNPGLRSMAIDYSGATFNCNSQDLAVTSLLAPDFPSSAFCFDDSLFITLGLANVGDSTFSSFSYGFQVDQMPPVSQTYGAPIAGCEYLVLNLADATPALSAGYHEFKLWVNTPGDQNAANDTLRQIIRISGVPFGETFEQFDICSQESNCEEEICDLTNGWVNITNGVGDDVDWRISFGETPSPNTGPSTDHRPGNAQGKYLYVEASGCFQQEARVLSPCIDLSGLQAPTLTFWYHMFGVNMGSLHLDVFDGTTWVLDFMPPIIGNQGAIWNQASVDLTSLVGNNIQFRLRANTGPSFQSDIAVDNFEILDVNSPPLPDFFAAVQEVCPSQPVSFQDLTVPQVNTYIWAFNPATVTYLDGTNATSANPVVRFNVPGSYEARLTVANSNGVVTETKTSYIQVDPGDPLPMTENFEAEDLCSTDGDCGAIVCDLLSTYWSNVANGIDDDIDWRVNSGETPSVDTGPTFDYTTGTDTGKYVYLEATQCFGSEGILISPCIDLTDQNRTYLWFKYHMFGTDMGELHVDVLHEGVWDLDVTAPIIGNQGAAWQGRRVNLLAYGGSSIQIRFRARTGADFRSDIALDDISIRNVDPPVAEFALADEVICQGTTILLSDASQGEEITNRSWSFGFGASIPNGNGPGPFPIRYDSVGQAEVSLIVSNFVGSDTITRILTVIDSAEADFSAFSADTSTYEFAALDTAPYHSYLWDFGDGNTSILPDPVHTYNVDGNYEVTLFVTNACGTDSSLQEVLVTTASIDDALGGLTVRLAPNPNEGRFKVWLEGNVQGPVQLNLMDSRGRSISSQRVDFWGSNTVTEFDAEGLSEGVYVLQVNLGARSMYRRVFIQP